MVASNWVHVSVDGFGGLWGKGRDGGDFRGKGMWVRARGENYGLVRREDEGGELAIGRM